MDCKSGLAGWSSGPSLPFLCLLLLLERTVAVYCSSESVDAALTLTTWGEHNEAKLSVRGLPTGLDSKLYSVAQWRRPQFTARFTTPYSTTVLAELKLSLSTLGRYIIAAEAVSNVLHSVFQANHSPGSAGKQAAGLEMNAEKITLLDARISGYPLRHS
ncbi:hypothetical protein KRP22_008041 [Phytophthora ramorum]|nr:hypothetical protein KRP22_3949 [Phytophthora ramorum]